MYNVGGWGRCRKEGAAMRVEFAGRDMVRVILRNNGVGRGGRIGLGR
jgi:hypothetical protein